MADDESQSNDMKHIRRMLTELMASQREAESEIPEKMRRFTAYAHDMNSMVHMYEERGLTVPDYLHREMERIDDRLRHLLQDLKSDDGAFVKVQQDMAQREGNRWNYTPQLTSEKRDEGNN